MVVNEERSELENRVSGSLNTNSPKFEFSARVWVMKSSRLGNIRSRSILVVVVVIFRSQSSDCYASLHAIECRHFFSQKKEKKNINAMPVYTRM